jgi:DNA repair protein RecO (recombination protein O)
MIYKARGIVFHSIKYSETSLITRIYTDRFGLQSYLVRGARKPRAKLRASLFQPLNILEMEVYRKEKNNLQNIKEARQASIFESIPFDIRKGSISMFMGDILSKTIKEEEANPGLFDFIYSMIMKLDKQKAEIADFHLHFLIQLSRHLGFFPQGKYDQQMPFFDMQEGSFCREQPSHSQYLNYPLSESLSLLIHVHPTESISLKIDRNERNQLLESIISYYRLHYDSLQDIQSHQVLRKIFDQP